MSAMLGKVTVLALVVLPIAAILSIVRGQYLVAGTCLILFSFSLYVRETRTD